MGTDFWGKIFVGLVLLLLGSLLLEAMLVPRPNFKKRCFDAWLVHCGICLITYAIELVLFQRAVFGAVIALSALLLLVTVSNVKMAMLREPFLFQDFEYFSDLFRHPRLYIPFFGIWKTIIGVISFFIFFYVGIISETSLLSKNEWKYYLLVLLLLLVCATIFLKAAKNYSLSLTFNPIEDMNEVGLLAYLWWYALAELTPIQKSSNNPFNKIIKDKLPSVFKDIVVVQSESFFDPRRVYPDISSHVVKFFDDIRSVAFQYGFLTVPAWGANTVRTEFSFLSGLSSKDLGVHRFNPYRKLASKDVPTLASHLRRLGYKTICVHPYMASFYRREKVYPNMGFDEFIDISSFSESDYCGSYIGDIAVGRVVSELLVNSVQPVFIFAITMENHGPLHWEQACAFDEVRLYNNFPPTCFSDLTVYLRHIENSDQMLLIIREALEKNKREGILCWYGDHVPIMPDVYKKTNFGDARTDYFLWESNFQINDAPIFEDLRVEELSIVLLERLFARNK